MLPLAISGSLLLLLSSLSFQALALQHRAQLQVQQQRLLLEDQLSSAAQRLAGQLQRRHGCLLPLPMAAWSEAPCAEGLSAVQLLPADLELLAYSPAEGRSELLLRRRSGGAAGAFALHWQASGDGGSPQLRALQFRGLRGVAR